MGVFYELGWPGAIFLAGYLIVIGIAVLWIAVNVALLIGTLGECLVKMFRSGEPE